jgi:hypothetical protein
MDPIPVADGYSIVADPDSDETFTAISGAPPLFVVGQGQQLFDLVGPEGSVVGKFTADVTTTGDGLAGKSEALIVTSDVTGTAGTDPGDVPPVGSVFNILYFFNPDIYNVYSDLASPTSGGQNVIADTFYTPSGKFDFPTTFDAVQGLTDGTPQYKSIPFGDDLHIAAAPDSSETYTGINSQPPFSVSIQGYQKFDILDSDNNVLASFKADVTNYSDFFGNRDEALLVTQDGNDGTTPGDAPPVGSWIEYTTYGTSGFGSIYTDLTGDPQNTITETLITPFGDFSIPTTIDAAAGLADVDFYVPS